MVALVDDDQPVVVEQGAGVLPAGDGLKHRRVDHSGRAVLAAPDRPDVGSRHAEVHAQPVLPLGEELPPFHEHERGYVVVGDGRAGDHRLARTGRGHKDPSVVADDLADGDGLLRPEIAGEAQAQRRVAGPGVGEIEPAAEPGDEILHRLDHSPGQVQPLQVLPVAADEAGRVPGGEAHPLLLVEHRVVYRRQVLEGRHHRRGKPRPPYRDGGSELSSDRGRRRWTVLPDQVGPRQAGAGVDGPQRFRQHRDRLPAEAGDGRQECPLVLPRTQRRRVDERGRSPIEAASVEGERDQVPEGTLGHEVLGREEAVVARQVQLGAGSHRLAKQRRAQHSGGGRGHLLLEEDPHVGTIARARYLHHRRHLRGVTGVEVCQGIERPRATVEITGEEGAGVAGQERVDPDGRVAAQVAGDHLVGEREVLLAYPLGGRPTTRRWGPARAAAGGVLPADGEHVRAGPEQRAHELDLLCSGCRAIEARLLGRRAEERRRHLRWCPSFGRRSSPRSPRRRAFSSRSDATSATASASRPSWSPSTSVILAPGGGPPRHHGCSGRRPRCQRALRHRGH